MAQKIQKRETYRYKYSICTLVTRLSEYQGMLETFYDAGFEETDCEYLYVDNTQVNEFDAFGAINRFLREAAGEYIIICHQDILINFDNRQKLDDQIEQVSRLDSNWAVLGNAGINNMYQRSMVITHADGKIHRSGQLPSKVHSLDENFLLIKSSANIAVSGNLNGFHMYGADICLVADCLGYSAYAIDFHLTHTGKGVMNQSFYTISKSLTKKYSRFFRSRYIRTTMTSVFISQNPFYRWLMNMAFIKNVVRVYNKMAVRYSLNT